MNTEFWKGKSVFITGHTGFKGSWLTIWLSQLGARVTGYSLDPPTNPSLYELANVKSNIDKSYIADIRNYELLEEAISSAHPEVVFHLAAQPLVLDSYADPMKTFTTNILGTVNLFEAVRKQKSVRALVNITTDKVYENKEWIWGYKEIDALGGYDPYSCSKACSDLISSSYRDSFFKKNDERRTGIATARAGNVIGGGDWAPNRLVSDCIKSLLKNEKIIIRNEGSIRPWQHVLEPLNGYLLLAENLHNNPEDFSEPFNFGPDNSEQKTVGYVANKLISLWSNKSGPEIVLEKSKFHETNYLRLDNSKAVSRLQWKPRWSVDTALQKIIDWTRVYASSGDLAAECTKQISDYSNS